MNGRVYDPEVARFLSADPFVQFPGSTQGYNRYAYVNNNPLSYTDPSGYFLETLQVLAISFSTVQGAKAGGISGAIKGFALAGASAGIANAIGNAFPTSVTNTASVTTANAGTATASITTGIQQGFARQLAKAALHGLTQGALSAAGGGRFGDGFLGAAFSSFMGDHVSRDPALGTLQAAVIGGTVSAIGGGKFANGAVSAAFVHVFNHLGHGHNSFEQRAARYREMQAELNALGIDTVWFGAASDLNAFFADNENFLLSARGFMNNLGVHLYEHNAATFNALKSGDVTLRGQALDNFLVQKEQSLVQDFLADRFDGDVPLSVQVPVNASFRMGRSMMPATMSNGINYVEAHNGQRFNFWDTWHRIELGQAMMSQYRHGR
jgi:hypothetical protein